MGSWVKWLSNGGDDNHQSFPCLRQLNMKKCPKLNGGCTLILPSLVEINIDGCDGGLFTCLEGLTSMTKMNISKISELVHFEGSLATSWVALEEIKIVECPLFKSFVEGDEVKQVPPKLKILEIKECGELEKLPDDLWELTSLSQLSVADCENLCCFPSGGLPSSLRRLKLEGCPRLPQSQLISNRLLGYLEEIRLDNLDGLFSITELVGLGSPLSRSLRTLEISKCRSLTTLTDSLQHLSALSRLTLNKCAALKMEIFPSLPCNLSFFQLSNCPKVKSLPHDMDRITSLKSLWIFNNRGITSLSTRGGLPTNLEDLWISGCKNLNQAIEEWGLRDLTALRGLSIWGEMECVDEMECFPPGVDDGGWSRLLPSTLHHLTIGYMKKLERVGGGLRHHLTSLQLLSIYGCNRVWSLPDDGLPDSLESLTIQSSRVLEGKCRKGEGEYWHSLHLGLIPEVNIS